MEIILKKNISFKGGGMDQAIELLAVAGQAKLIEFNPLVAHDTKLPQGSVFVISNSLQVRKFWTLSVW